MKGAVMEEESDKGRNENQIRVEKTVIKSSRLIFKAKGLTINRYYYDNTDQHRQQCRRKRTFENVYFRGTRKSVNAF